MKVSQLSLTLCDPVACRTPGFRVMDTITNSRGLLKLMSIESVMPSNHLILCRPLLFPLSIFPSIKVFFIELTLHIRWPKYWSFSFSITEVPGLEGVKNLGGFTPKRTESRD